MATGCGSRQPQARASTKELTNRVSYCFLVIRLASAYGDSARRSLNVIRGGSPGRMQDYPGLFNSHRAAMAQIQDSRHCFRLTYRDPLPVARQPHRSRGRSRHGMSMSKWSSAEWPSKAHWSLTTFVISTPLNDADVSRRQASPRSLVSLLLVPGSALLVANGPQRSAPILLQSNSKYYGTVQWGAAGLSSLQRQCLDRASAEDRI